MRDPVVDWDYGYSDECPTCGQTAKPGVSGDDVHPPGHCQTCGNEELSVPEGRGMLLSELLNDPAPRIQRVFNDRRPNK
jgi:hypothetical protein